MRAQLSEGHGRLLPVLGTEQTLLVAGCMLHRSTGSTCCCGRHSFGQPAQDEAKTPGSKGTEYGRAHLLGAPDAGAMQPELPAPAAQCGTNHLKHYSTAARETLAAGRPWP